MYYQWRAVYIERCKYGSGRGIAETCVCKGVRRCLPTLRVRIKSKEFVSELLRENGMDEVINYAIPGTYIGERGIIVFMIQDAFKNTQATTA